MDDLSFILHLFLVFEFGLRLISVGYDLAIYIYMFAVYNDEGEVSVVLMNTAVRIHFM